MKKILVLLAVLLLGAAVRPASAERVGVILTREVPLYAEIHEALKRELKGSGVELVVQRPYPDPISWSNAARKLLVADVKVLITYGGAATLAALRERPRVPVLYAGLYGPVAFGIRDKKATGVYTNLPVGSLFRYLKESTAMRSMAVVYNAWEEDSAYQYARLSRIARKYGVRLVGINLRRPADVSAALAGKEMDALYIPLCATASTVYPTLIKIASAKRVATASLLKGRGASPVLTLTFDAAEHGRLAAGLLKRLLRGSRPQELHRLEAKGLRLVYNLREATRLGLRVSMSLVTTATEVIY